MWPFHQFCHCKVNKLQNLLSLLRGICSIPPGMYDTPVYLATTSVGYHPIQRVDNCSCSQQDYRWKDSNEIKYFMFICQPDAIIKRARPCWRAKDSRALVYNFPCKCFHRSKIVQKNTLVPPFFCTNQWAAEFFRVLPKFGTFHQLFCSNVGWERHSNSQSPLTLQIKWGAPILVRARQSAVRWKSKHFISIFFAVVTATRPFTHLTDEQSLSASLHVPDDWIQTLPAASAPTRWSIKHQLVNKKGNKNESQAWETMPLGSN